MLSDVTGKDTREGGIGWADLDKDVRSTIGALANKINQLDSENVELRRRLDTLESQQTGRELRKARDEGDDEWRIR